MFIEDLRSPIRDCLESPEIVSLLEALQGLREAWWTRMPNSWAVSIPLAHIRRGCFL